MSVHDGATVKTLLQCLETLCQDYHIRNAPVSGLKRSNISKLHSSDTSELLMSPCEVKPLSIPNGGNQGQKRNRSKSPPLPFKEFKTMRISSPIYSVLGGSVEKGRSNNNGSPLEESDFGEDSVSSNQDDFDSTLFSLKDSPSTEMDESAIDVFDRRFIQASKKGLKNPLSKGGVACTFESQFHGLNDSPPTVSIIVNGDDIPVLSLGKEKFEADLERILSSAEHLQSFSLDSNADFRKIKEFFEINCHVLEKCLFAREFHDASTTNNKVLAVFQNTFSLWLSHLEAKATTLSNSVIRSGSFIAIVAFLAKMSLKFGNRIITRDCALSLICLSVLYLRETLSLFNSTVKFQTKSRIMSLFEPVNRFLYHLKVILSQMNLITCDSPSSNCNITDNDMILDHQFGPEELSQTLLELGICLFETIASNCSPSNINSKINVVTASPSFQCQWILFGCKYFYRICQLFGVARNYEVRIRHLVENLHT